MTWGRSQLGRQELKEGTENGGPAQAHLGRQDLR